MLAIAIIAAGLIISVSASTAIRIQKQEKPTFFLNKNPEMKIAGMEIAQIIGEKQIIIQSKEKADPVFLGYHPAVASDTLDYVVMGFEDESPNVWFTASDDLGQNWAIEAYGWDIDPEPKLPDLDYCGDGRFIGGMVPHLDASNGSELYKVIISDPMDFTPGTGGYSLPVWTYTDGGYVNFTAIAVAGYTAEDSDENTWAYGGHAIVGDHKGESGENTNFFHYQFDETGYAWIYSWTGLNGASDCAHDIDPGNLYSYAAWNFDNEGDQDIYVNVVDFGTWEPYQENVIHPHVTALSIEAIGDDEYIDISAFNDNIILVSQRDEDIVAYYSLDGMSNVMDSIIYSGAINPRIVHNYDLNATCTYIIDEQVYYSKTMDGGATWSTAKLIDEPENDYVPEEYKASDVCGTGASWMNEGDGYVYYALDVDLGTPPDAPTIEGEENGDAGTEYEYTFNALDPDGDRLSYYIEWGDGETTDWTDFQDSGIPYSEGHTWEKGTWTIKAKAKDEIGLVSSEGTLTVTMPRNRVVNRPFLQFLKQYYILFPTLRVLLQRLGLQ